MSRSPSHGKNMWTRGRPPVILFYFQRWQYASLSSQRLLVTEGTFDSPKGSILLTDVGLVWCLVSPTSDAVSNLITLSHPEKFVTCLYVILFGLLLPVIQSTEEHGRRYWHNFTNFQGALLREEEEEEKKRSKSESSKNFAVRRKLRQWSLTMKSLTSSSLRI